MDDQGTLKTGEYHPSADSAIKYVKEILSYPDFLILMEALANAAISGNRLAEVCLATMQRILNGDPVSDRYILGLAWFLKEREELNNRKQMKIQTKIRRRNNAIY